MTTQLVSYHVTEAQIAATREACAALTADTPAGYEAVRQAIAHLRDTRGAIERRRVELKADALAWGRSVDAEAKRFTALLAEIEEPLKAKKAVIDDEKARLKAEADAERLRVLEAEICANQERQEAEARAAREAEEARLAEERARLDAERAALAEERRQADEAARVAREQREADEAALRAERDALDAERRAVEAERARAEREEFERQARIKAEADAAAKVEQDRIDALERQARLDALRPDLEKVDAFTAALRAVPVPKVKSKKLAALLADGAAGVAAVADRIDQSVQSAKAAA